LSAQSPASSIDDNVQSVAAVAKVLLMVYSVAMVDTTAEKVACMNAKMVDGHATMASTIAAPGATI
jgi:hypothetical protein